MGRTRSIGSGSSSDRLQELQGHDEDRDDQGRLDQLVPLFDRRLDRAPPAKGVSGGKAQAIGPVHVSGDDEDDQSRNGIDKDDEDLVHVHVDEVKLQKIIHHRHEDEPDPHLDETAVESDEEHRQKHHPVDLLVFRVVQSHLRFGNEHRDDDPDHDDGQDFLKEPVADLHR